MTERERPARESARELSGDHRHVALCSRCGMARKTTHYLVHRRSSQSEELTTRTCIVRPSEVRTPMPKNDRCDLRSRELSGDQLDFT